MDELQAVVVFRANLSAPVQHIPGANHSANFVPRERFVIIQERFTRSYSGES